MRRLFTRVLVGLVIILFSLGMLELLVSAVRSDWSRDAAIARALTYKADIVRDDFGVPHIYGDRDVDVAFALSYAQAEDDFETMQGLIPFYRGELSREIGSKGLPIDFLIAWLDIRRQVEARFETDLSPEVKANLQAYADGLNYYAALHPRQAKAGYFPITAQDLATGFSIQHLLFYGFDGVIGKLFEGETPDNMAKDPETNPITAHIGAKGLPVGSNAFVANARKTTDGATRVMINSHQPLTGPVAWYEAHLKSNEGWNVHGGLFPGMPFIAKGFNAHIGWGVTVNKPDLIDIYKLTLNQEDNDAYMLDGKSVEFEKRRAWLKLKIFGDLYIPIPRTLLSSKHGPALETDHGVYAVRFAGMNEIRQPEQWFAMNKATNLTEFKKAMALQAIVSFNFVYGDKDGNIYFLHNSRSPRRVDGWDWSKYLPGDRSDLIWQEQISFEEMPQLTNPKSGYLISTNQTPFQVTAEADNLSPSDYPVTLGLQTRMTNRAVQGLAMFDAKKRLNAEDFDAIKWDNTYHPDSRARKYVDLIQTLNVSSEQERAAQTLLAQWSGQAIAEDRAAPLAVCLISAEWLAEQKQKPTPDIEPVFKTCLTNLETNFGRIDPKWSEVNRLCRGDVNLPLNGGPDTLRAIYGRPDDNGRLCAVAGDGLVVSVSWDRSGNQSARMIHNFGAAATNKSSPHYANQAPLYASETFRPIALSREQVEAGRHQTLSLPKN